MEAWRLLLGASVFHPAFQRSFCLAVALVLGCAEQQTERCVEPMRTTIVERLTFSRLDKVDLLLAVDDSPGMGDKQQILAWAVPELIGRLWNPRCVDHAGKPVGPQPAGPDGECAPGSRREMAAMADIHIGVVGSSLGGHGADVCLQQDDRGHLKGADGTGGFVDALGYLAWDPTGAALAGNARSMVEGVGEGGCRVEAQLESWYRFLIDPDPPAAIEVENNSAVLVGTDEVLLQQRAEFLRPDSLLVIVMLGDENDCSIRDGGQYFWAARRLMPGADPMSGELYHLPRPRAACAFDPGSPCCRSCGQSPGSGCDDSADDCSAPLDAGDDPYELRCFHQKRRFGIDFLWPVDRYVTGLTSTAVQDRHGNLVPNPIYSDLDPHDDNANIRNSGLVMLAAITGVPWQDIARRDEQGQPDLALGLQSAAELTESGAWDLVLGDPAHYVPPADPWMIESIEPRPGVNPVTGQASPHERDIPDRDDLQYTCTYPLSAPRDCADSAHSSCECKLPNGPSPLCDGQIQTHGKAYPGLRELSLVRELGTQGIVGSACPAQLADPTRLDFGYRAAIAAVADRVRRELDGACLSRSLTPDEQGRVDCALIEATRGPGPCDCTGPGRRPITPSLQRYVDPTSHGDPNASWTCFCELVQASGADLVACQTIAHEPVLNAATGKQVHGWCYVDAITSPPIGNPKIVEDCPLTERRTIRYVGDGWPRDGATTMLLCDLPPPPVCPTPRD